MPPSANEPVRHIPSSAPATQATSDQADIVAPPTNQPIPITTPEPGGNQTVGAEAAAGIPPKPDAQTENSYIAALDRIDPDIVHGEQDKAVSRGRNQCSSVKNQPDNRSKLVSLTQQRFSSPDHPGGFGPAKSGQILDVVRKYLCPTF